SSRRRHTRWPRDWSSDVCSSDLSACIFADDIFCQHAPQAFAPEFGPKIQALHLADFGLQLVQSHASCQLAFIQSEPQAAIGWLRSEERRVGKEGRARGGAEQWRE